MSLSEPLSAPFSAPLCRLRDLVNIFQLDAASEDLTAAVQGVALDSRRIQDGCIFAALPGTKHHGAEFASDAAGAVAILTDQQGRELIGSSSRVPVLVSKQLGHQLGPISAHIYGNPSKHMQLIGITGTSGKTTTSYLVQAALGSLGQVGLVGTIEVSIGDYSLPSLLTTPQAPQLQEIFSHMLSRGAAAAVMEVSSHALTQGRVRGSEFSAIAFTNLSHDHLDYHVTMEDYYQAKKQLFIDPSYGKPTPIIVVNDSWGKRLATEIGREAITISGNSEVQASYTVVNYNSSTMVNSATILGPDKSTFELTISLPGRYNIINALCAVVLAEVSGVPRADALARVSQVRVPGRLEVIEGGQPFAVVVDYAHKPAALAAVLTTLRESGISEGARLGVVIGAGGNRDSDKRLPMGAIAAQLADYVVITDDNPRDEDPAVIRSALAQGASSVSSEAVVEIISPRDKAIANAVEWAQPGDIVLIAGKGHEVGQEVAGEKTPFDDREQAWTALQKRKEKHGWD